jgi:hypothetical protein
MVVVVQNPSLYAYANICHLCRVSKTNASITIKKQLICSQSNMSPGEGK